jgi:hypothetical protein
LLKVGDVVRVKIDGIGEPRNTVVEEPTAISRPWSSKAPPGLVR